MNDTQETQPITPMEEKPAITEVIGKYLPELSTADTVEAREAVLKNAVTEAYNKGQNEGFTSGSDSASQAFSGPGGGRFF